MKLNCSTREVAINIERNIYNFFFFSGFRLINLRCHFDYLKQFLQFPQNKKELNKMEMN